MILIPAIDIRGGNVVRLVQGNYNNEKVYSTDPPSVAQQWVHAGAQMLHIVDLDGAREGIPFNIAVLEKVAKDISVPIQMGGGLRTIQAVQTILSLGVKRVVIGTKAFDQEFLKELISRFGNERIVVGIDASGDNVQIEGWVRESGYSIERACEHAMCCGVKYVVFTDITRDGTLKGPNIESLRKVLSCSSLHIIVSGGIGSLDDIKRIADLKEDKISGVIIGKALYEKKFSFKDALRLL